MYTGWLYDEDNDEIYYLTEDGTLRTHSMIIDDVYYMFDYDGKMLDPNDYDDGRYEEDHTVETGIDIALGIFGAVKARVKYFGKKTLKYIGKKALKEADKEAVEYGDKKGVKYIGKDVAKEVSKGNITSVAKVKVDKFSNYIFKDGATHGKNIVFENLGYGKGDSEYLANLYMEQANAKFAKGEYTLGKLDEYGQLINIEIELNGIGDCSGKTIYLKSGWMINSDKTISLNTPFTGFTR